MAGPPLGGRIGQKITDMVADGTVKARTAIATAEGALRQQATIGILETLEKEAAGSAAEQLALALDADDLDDDAKDTIKAMLAPKRPIQLIIMLGLTVSGAFAMGAAALSGVIDRVARWSMRTQADRKLPASEAVAGVTRGLIPFTEGMEAARDEGFRADVFDRLVQVGTTQVPAGEVLTLVNRGDLSEGEGRDRLEKLGFNRNGVDDLMRLRLAFPTAPDVVRMAVKEVFNKPVAQRFGQFEDVSPDYLKAAEQAGLSREFAINFWAAHWDLPSVFQGFEMFHRGIIGQDDLNSLLKALDIMPFWRDRLTEMSYNPVTRVDVRRMYRMGVATIEQVNRAYLDLGYSPQNAQLLTDFTVKEKLESERELTKAEIVQLFEAQTFDRTKATALIVDLGYTAEEAAFILDLGEQRRATSKKNRAINVVRARFLAYRIDEPQASGQMDALDVPAAQRDEEIRIWKVEREVSAPRIAIGTLQRFAKKGIIDTTEFITRAQRLGFSDDEVFWYAQDAGIEGT